MPALAKTCPPPVKIWSAACASGEEPLTIAMALELAGWFDRIPIEIHASDASCQALRAAKTGFYRERSFRSFPLVHRERFLRKLRTGGKSGPAFTAASNGTTRISQRIQMSIRLLAYL